MAYKVLIVDDSHFFQTRLKEIVNSHPDLVVIGVAANGQEAIDMARELRPDVISMDYEMPYLNGVSAVRAIMAERPVPIVMFSSLTYEGARITLEALHAGAVDFLPKNFADVSRGSDRLKRKLQDSLLFYAREARARVPMARSAQGTRTPRDSRATQPDSKSLRARVELLIIGASTGGPVAVTDVLTQLPENFDVPIIVVQHMPENFTRVFAEGLNRRCAIQVREARNGDLLEPGLVLIAPGGLQLMFNHQKDRIKVIEGDNRMTYKPSVDITFASAANVFTHHVLGVVLTGMGADGCNGARLLKEKGSLIWAQNQESCIVYGMPGAVAKAGLIDASMSPGDLGTRLAREWTV